MSFAGMSLTLFIQQHPPLIGTGAALSTVLRAAGPHPKVFHSEGRHFRAGGIQ